MTGSGAKTQLMLISGLKRLHQFFIFMTIIIADRLIEKSLNVRDRDYTAVDQLYHAKAMQGDRNQSGYAAPLYSSHSRSSGS